LDDMIVSVDGDDINTGLKQIDRHSVPELAQPEDCEALPGSNHCRPQSISMPSTDHDVGLCIVIFELRAFTNQ
jgi:hypothetical protein